jgi:Resolvase, N terminal domain
MSRRERERAEERRADARAWAEAEQKRYARWEPPDYSDPINEDRNRPARPRRHGFTTLNEVMESEVVTEVYGYCRTSGDKQDVKAISRAVRRYLKNLGLKVRHIFADIASGKTIEPQDRPKLYRAIEASKKREIWLVIPAFTRLIRNRAWSKTVDPNARPTVAELEALLEKIPCARIVFLHDPDADPASDEAFLRDLNARFNRRKPGRSKNKAKGDSKRRNGRWRSRVIEMLGRGMKPEEIMDVIYEEDGESISRQSIWRWGKAAIQATAR